MPSGFIREGQEVHPCGGPGEGAADVAAVAPPARSPGAIEAGGAEAGQFSTSPSSSSQPGSGRG